MKSKSSLLSKIAASLIFVMSANLAQATTYLGSRTVGSAIASYSLTTDGSLGPIYGSHITDYSLKLTKGSSSQTISKSSGGFFAETFGPDIIATTTSLSFDFDQVGIHYLIIDGNIGFICFQTQGCFDPPTAGTGIFVFNDFSTSIKADSGVHVIATVVSGVPDSPTWMLFLIGFAISGYAIRRSVANPHRRPASVTRRFNSLLAAA